MIILDTDIISHVQRDDSPEGLRVRARIAQLPPREIVATTIITYEEQTKGWLKFLARARTRTEQVAAYLLLGKHVEDYRESRVIQYDDPSADMFERLRTSHRRMGTMDLKIACIALVHNALLVTRNIQDFRNIPDLRIEDWAKV